MKKQESVKFTGADLEKALKAQRRRTLLYKIGTIVGGTGTLLLLIQN